MQSIEFPQPKADKEAHSERMRLRAFLENEVRAGSFDPLMSSWTTFDRDFSRKLGAAGFIGVSLPCEFGGGGKSFSVRHAIMEELLAAGAPVGAHWMAERQSAMQIVHYGSASAKNELLPRIIAGTCYFGIGVSEPNAGSDLAAARTSARKVDGGWLLNGSKIWTTNGNKTDYLLVLARTSAKAEQRHEGFTQFIVDMQSPGVEVRPIYDLNNDAEFAEEVFINCFVPDDYVLGEIDKGWGVVLSELVFERSGPDRLLTSFQLLQALETRLSLSGNGHDAESEIGRMIAHLATLRRMSMGVSSLIEAKQPASLQAALVKDLGAVFEREVPELARDLVSVSLARGATIDSFTNAVTQGIMRAPSWSIRGGAREILRGMIARELGLR
ncbi:acyl-CoA dehydrogenase family protein [Rhodopseudomonas pseudopalustris]|uniref:Acyl-CoA dehydrogenase n=1 Tax=Rhodopseudomonas pseudopalustris TaxID=1513892 RepID=A0A1H8M865_9BRAD|nr:acyl-CoA dehydrogenase family protein [Rhodopseudomonas pseudopalustris]SEO13577.1 Acyl-CoA dehydrogenase [Rhodopseudomonas pseudopalustris]